jgi:GPH family glycoside/pentoside/hexuronide:cation symporter
MAQSSAPQEHVPLVSRIWISVADAATAMLQNFAGAGALTYFFTRWRGLRPELASIVWIAFGFWNAVNDPLFGYVSDCTTSKLGRRIPYIRYGAPAFALAFAGFWLLVPGLDSQAAMFVQLLALLFIFDTLYTAIATSIYVMPYEMAVSNKARSTIYIWKIAFMVFPLAVPLILVPMIQPGPGEDGALFQAVMVGFGIVMGLLILVSSFFYREKCLQQAEGQPGLITSLKECFKNRPFVIFEVISFTMIYAQTGLMQGVLYYFEELDVPGVPLYVALAVGIVAGVILWLSKRDAWGVKRSTRLMTLIFFAGCLVMMLGGRHVITAALGFLLFGFGFAGGMYLIPLMNGDVVDWDEHRTSLRREGMYAGVNSFITKPAISLAQAAFLTITVWFGYDPELAQGAQSTSAQTGILVGWTLVPGLLLFLCFVALKWYPLAGPAWETIKQGLAERHARKEAETLAQMGLEPLE